MISSSTTRAELDLNYACPNVPGRRCGRCARPELALHRQPVAVLTYSGAVPRRAERMRRCHHAATDRQHLHADLNDDQHMWTMRSARAGANAPTLRTSQRTETKSPRAALVPARAADTTQERADLDHCMTSTTSTGRLSSVTLRARCTLAAASRYCSSPACVRGGGRTRTRPTIPSRRVPHFEIYVFETYDNAPGAGCRERAVARVNYASCPTCSF